MTKAAAQNDEEILIVLGDTICDYNLKEVLQSETSMIGVRKVDDPRSFGVAELNENDQVVRMVEKPLIPKSNMAMVGVYFIKKAALMYEILDQQLENHAQEEGEYHLTNALQLMIEQGSYMKAFRVNNWFDCGKKETLLATNAILLKQLNNSDSPRQNSQYINSVIIPPVSIAEGCHIVDSIIGPNVSIGEQTKVQSAIIKDSIIGSYAELDEVVLHSSIIGSDAFVRGLSQSLNIGDNTEIDLG